MATITKSAPLVALMALAIFAPTAAQAQDEPYKRAPTHRRHGAPIPQAAEAAGLLRGP